MDYIKYINYSVEDFVLDKDFTQWILSPDQESDKYWNLFIQYNPGKRKHIEEASSLIKAIRAIEPPVSHDRLLEVYRNIKPPQKTTRRSISLFTRYAAVFIFLCCIGGTFYFFTGNQDELPAMMAEKELLEKGRIILPDGSINEFDDKISDIRQRPTGELTLNDDTISLTQPSVSKNKNELAHVIIPYGKRSEITLSDGTRIWLNSGSQLSYPVIFSNDSRTVYLSGEAFFEVNADPARPFHVITTDMKIEVTGTRFNVTSYHEDETTMAVLVTGKIHASKNKKLTRSIELTAGERIVYNKQGEVFKKDHVNVELFSSWVEGYLLFENEPVDKIITKLERYYNKKILTQNLTGNQLFTGKLDLAGDIEKVLKNIAFSASFSIVYENETYIVKP